MNAVARFPHTVRLEADREIYIPPPLKRERIPGWLKIRLTPHKKRLNTVNHIDALRQLARGSGHWLDHWGMTTFDGKDFFVSEPYTLSAEMVSGITDFAALLKLDFTIHAASAHFPTGTLRLMFLPKEQSSGFPFCLDKGHDRFFGG
jgi:hypothetical protein